MIVFMIFLITGRLSLEVYIYIYIYMIVIMHRQEKDVPILLCSSPVCRQCACCCRSRWAEKIASTVDGRARAVGVIEQRRQP